MKKRFLFLIFCSLVQIIHGQTNTIALNRFPQFPGGEDSLKSYIKHNFIMPDSEWVENVRNFRIMVVFIIDTFGNRTNIKVRESAGTRFDTEAIRLVREMPKWQPAIENGKKISFTYSLPIKISFY